MIFAIIPAREGSSRFPGKPLAIIGQKPMIHHVYERTKACTKVNHIFVATDSLRIINCMDQLKSGITILTSDRHKTGTDRIAEAVRSIDIPVDDSDIIVNIQGDQPVFNSRCLDYLLESMQNDKAFMSTLAYPTSTLINDPKIVKVVFDKNFNALYFSRSVIPFYRNKTNVKHYYKHLGFYAYRPWFLSDLSKLPRSEMEITEDLEQLRVLENGDKIKVSQCPYDSFAVDCPGDVLFLNSILFDKTMKCSEWETVQKQGFKTGSKEYFKILCPPNCVASVGDVRVKCGIKYFD